MLRQWTIEIRADFADPEKNDAITEAVRQHSAAINGTMIMIKDNGISPEVVCYSDDFFSGHQDILLIEDKLGNAKAAAAEDTPSETMVVSDEMMQAMRDMQHDKNNKV